MPRIAFYAGSFDPVTNGHVDVVRHAAALADRLVLAIGIHPGKSPLFGVGERLEMLEETCGPIARKAGAKVICTTFAGLVVDAARKAGRVVKELKAPEGWRAVPKRAGGSDYAFKTPQIKGQMVVKAEAVLEHARRRLAEIAHPEYLAKPVLFVGELEAGAAGTVSFAVVHQVSGTEAVVRVAPDAELGRPGGTSSAKEIYLSDFPARDYRPGTVLRDWTIEVTGTKTYQADNGRTKTAPHAKPLEWRKWVELVRRP